MKKLFQFPLLFVLLLLFTFLLPRPAPAQPSLVTAPTTLRPAAILTGSDVLSTTETIPADVNAVHYYISFTQGSLDSVSFFPAGAIDGNPTSTGYYKDTASSVTLTATANIHMRIPRQQLGAYQYHGVFAVGSGTATGSSATIKRKWEYKYDPITAKN